MVFGRLVESGDADASVRDKCCAILECSGLLHDIGNPPFGHFGEESIRSWFEVNLGKLKYGGKPVTELLNEQMKNDLTHFEGNAQALRLLTKLHYLIDENGMNLTFALLNTLIKYPVSSLETDKHSRDIKLHKMGYYLAEEDIFRRITTATGAGSSRYPLTYLLESADDIAYLTADIEDSVKKGFISYNTLLADLKSEGFIDGFNSPEDKKTYDNCIALLEAKLSDAEGRGLGDPGLNAVQNWVVSVQTIMLCGAADSFIGHYREIMDGSFTSALIPTSRANAISEALRHIAFERVFRSRKIMMSELTEGHMINFFLDKLVPAAIALESDKPLDPVSDRLMLMISGNYRRIYEHYSENRDTAYRLYLRILLVTDFVCGMTDSFAKRTYQQLSGVL